MRGTWERRRPTLSAAHAGESGRGVWRRGGSRELQQDEQTSQQGQPEIAEKDSQKKKKKKKAEKTQKKHKAETKTQGR